MKRVTFLIFIIMQLFLLNGTQNTFPKNKGKLINREITPSRITDTHNSKYNRYQQYNFVGQG